MKDPFVYFGFSKVSKDKKKSLVSKVFSNVATRYNIMNDVSSLGLHRLWKYKLVSKLYYSQNIKVLDLAGGTGDIALAIDKKFRSFGDLYQITVADCNQEMLYEGQKRAVDLNQIKNITWEEENGEGLSYSDHQFNYVTLAYGIRNFTDILAGLSECYRVLEEGGEFLCLEFSQVSEGFFQKIYDQYSFKILPYLGQLIVGDKESYVYLVESIRRFPDPEVFRQMMEDVGFKNVVKESFCNGVSILYRGWK